MPVEMTTDGSMVSWIGRSKKPLLGSDVRGWKARDLESALTDDKSQSPQSKKPRELFETIRWMDRDALTAHDHSLYEVLLVTARHDGIEKDSHKISLSDLMRHLDVAHVDRVFESLCRLADVRVTYGGGSDDVRVRGKVSLINFELTENLRSSAAVLEYSIPPQVRRLIMGSQAYAVVELNAFAGFSCKYTARLYPRLALRAGYHEHARKPWLIEPQKLANDLGYRYTKWNYSHFMRNVLRPVLDDIAEHVDRFSVRMDEVRGKGRGRPVEMLAFQTTPLRTSLREIKAAAITPAEQYRAQTFDPVHDYGELPSPAILSRAVTRTGRTPDELGEGYRAALEKGKRSPRDEIAPGLTGGFLSLMARRDGGDAAFEVWLDNLAPKEKIDDTRASKSSVPAPATADRKPIVEVDTPTYKRTTYPAYPKPVAPPPLAPVVVDDPLDYVDTAPKDSRQAVLDDECPF